MSKTKYSANPCGLHVPKPGTKGYVGTWTPPPAYEVTTPKRQRGRRAKSPRRRS